MISISEKDCDEILSYLRKQLSNTNDELNNLESILREEDITVGLARKFVEHDKSIVFDDNFKNQLLSVIREDYNRIKQVRDKLTSYIKILTLGSETNEKD